GLIKAVFATETLALGINMPARAVVVSSFTKFDGVNFTHLTTGELTQLMGRAGRRGIDVIGHGVILKESDVEVGTIYEVAMGPTRSELGRVRRGAGAERRSRRGHRGRTRGMGGAERVVQRLEVEAKGLLDRQRKLKVVRSPRFGEYLQRYGEIRTLQKELELGERDVSGHMDEYARKLRRLCKILTEAGFLANNRPTDKGLFASRVYGENTILVAEAVWAGWLEG